MKKVLSVLLAIAMVFCLAACGDKETTDENLPLYSQGLTKDGRYDIKALEYVALPEYKGVDFGEGFWDVSEEDVQAQIDQITENYGETVQITDRAIVSGDLVNIDYSGSVDGEKFDGGTAESQLVQAGGSNFIDDFLDQIIGHIPGDEFTIEVTFPDPYSNSPDLSGKDAQFEIKINHIQETIPADLTDEFVKENFGEKYGFDTVEGLRTYVSDGLIAKNQSSMIDSYFLDNCVVSSVPDTVFQHQKNCIISSYEQTAANYGVDIDTLAQYYGASSLDELIEQSEAEIVQMSTDVMIYQALAEDLGIEVKNADVADYFEEMTGSRDYSTYQSSYGLPYLKFVTMVEAVVKAVVAGAAK